MKRFLSIVLSVMMLLSAVSIPVFAADSITVMNAKTGVAYPIAVAPDAPATDRTAAEKLQKYLADMTGITPQIVSQYSEKAILIGQAAAEYVDTESMENEAYRIAVADGNLCIAGKGSRGTIYGVYGFLKDFCSCRWYTSELIVTPKAEKITVPANTDVTKKQYFEYRETDWISPKDKEYSLANHLNSGVYRRFSDAEGGNVNYISGFGHTFTGEFCSAAKYFDSNPEYFAYRNGERMPTQLCLTNEDVYNTVLSEVLGVIRSKYNPQNDNLQIVSLTQADNNDYCECDRCKAMAEKYGSQAGIMLKFVNRIAEAVEEAGYPNVAIDTFAYSYTRKVPAGIEARDNVIVRLCSIECCFCHTLDDGNCSENAAFMADLTGWSKICNRLYIWDYTVDYNATALTFSNFGVLQRNMQIFYENNVMGVYEEGAYYAQDVNVEFAELRAYLISLLLSDPYTDNYYSEMEAFMQAYYGNGWKNIKEYLDILQKMQSENGHMDIWKEANEIYTQITNEDIKYIDMLWKNASSMALTQEQRQHVALSEMSWTYWKCYNKKGEFSRWQLPSKWMGANESFYNDLVASGVTRLSESRGTLTKDMKLVKASYPYFWLSSKESNEGLMREYHFRYWLLTVIETPITIIKNIFGALNQK